MNRVRISYITITVLALILAALLGACGDDADESPGATTPAAPSSPGTILEATGTPEATHSPGAGDDATASPVRTAPSGVRLLEIPEDILAFISQFTETIPTISSCEYKDGSTTVDCSDAGFGSFEMEEPVPGEGVTCGARVLDNEPVYISCQGQNPPFAIIYRIVE